MSPTRPTAKRPRRSREPWKAPRDRRELLKSIGAATAVVVLSVGAVLFLGRDHLGSDDAPPSTPVTTSPTGSVTTPTTPATPDTTPPASIPPASTPPDSSAPAGETPTP
ncbi:MAG: hypothetical protein ACXW2C_01300 [Acidimicrobiia bacterium]